MDHAVDGNNFEVKDLENLQAIECRELGRGRNIQIHRKEFLKLTSAKFEGMQCFDPSQEIITWKSARGGLEDLFKQGFVLGGRVSGHVRIEG